MTRTLIRASAVASTIIILVTMPLSQGALAQPSRPPVVQDAITATLANCKETKLRRNFVRMQDINRDGKADYIVDYGKAECDGAGTLFCGTGGCTTQVFVSQPDGAYIRVLDEYIRGVKFRRVKGKPAMHLDLHGAACGRAGHQTCRKVRVWDGNGFVEN
jgi:hypothetical protein